MNKKSLSIIAVLSAILGNAAYAMDKAIITTAAIQTAIHVRGAQIEMQKQEAQRVAAQTQEAQRLAAIAIQMAHSNNQLQSNYVNDPASQASIDIVKSVQNQAYGWQIAYITPTKYTPNGKEDRVGTVFFTPYLQPEDDESDDVYLERLKKQRDALLEKERSERQALYTVIANFRSGQLTDTKTLLLTFYTTFNTLWGNSKEHKVTLSNGAHISFLAHPINLQTLIATVNLLYKAKGRRSIVLEQKRIELPKKIDLPAGSPTKWRLQTPEEYTEATHADMEKYYKNSSTKIRDCIFSRNDPVRLYLKYTDSVPQLIQNSN